MRNLGITIFESNYENYYKGFNDDISLTAVNAKFTIIILLISFLFSGAFAQQTSEGLAVKAETKISLGQVRQKLRTAKADTNKVNLLIQQSHLFWYAKTDSNRFLDSSLKAASSARELSDRLHFIKGSNEANFMMCRASVEMSDMKVANEVASKVYGEEHIRILLTIAEHFILRRDLRNQFENGYPNIIDALKASKSIGSSFWYYQSLMLLSKYYFIKGDLINGKKAILQIIRACEKGGDFASEAHYWSEMGLYMPKTDSTAQDIVHSHAMAVKFYLRIGNKKEAAYSLRDKAYADLEAGQPDLAEKDGLEAISILNSLKVTPEFYTYAMMADIYQKKGNFPKALQYAIASMSITGPISENDKWTGNGLLAILYDELKQPQKAMPYEELSYEHALSVNMRDAYFWKYRLIEDQIQTGDAKKALGQLLLFTKKYRAEDGLLKELMAAAFGDIYFALNDLDKAETHYLEMIKQDKIAMRELKKDLGFQNSIIASEAYSKIGRFYLAKKKYSIARRYFLAALKRPQSLNAEGRSFNEFLLFKADSALGYFVPAIRHFELSRNINDSMFNATKSRQISELEIQYETEQREKSILELKNKSFLQNEQLRREQLEKTIILAGTAMLLVIAVLAYNGYLNKRRSNLQLTKQQFEINDQNRKLKTLIEEKDWLLKEVHHRVKNNLQIVMGLLQRQSAYINNEEAVVAIKNSENRMHSIALIHQKLYQSQDINLICLREYISELISYLTETAAISNRLHFEKKLDDIYLNLSQAVPLGLILNEGLTNAIKYAYPDDAAGTIFVSLFSRKDNIVLTIEDHGQGLPPGFVIEDSTSFGLSLIRGLSKQLSGELDFDNSNGLKITLAFKPLNKSLDAS